MKLDDMWKRWGKQKGSYSKDLGRCKALHKPESNEWYLLAPRGESGGADHWGPWVFSAQESEAALAALVSWERKLARAGWFKLVTELVNGCEQWNIEQMQACVAKLPRCKQIPYYFQSSLDKARASKGWQHAVSDGGALRIGGYDVQERISRSVGLGPKKTLDLAITEPGVAPTSHGKCLSLLSMNGDELDALIAFLMKARLGLVSDDAFQAFGLHPEAASEQPATKTAIWERYNRMQLHSAVINDLVRDAGQIMPDRLVPIQIILDVLKAGDDVTEITVTKADRERPFMAVQIAPDSNTAKRIKDGVELAQSMAVAQMAGPLH